MNKKATILIVVSVLLAVMIVSTLIASAQAEPKVIVTRRFGGGIWYTQTNIILGGANNTIKIPDSWNGKLVVLCRVYSHTLDPNSIPMDAQSIMFLSMGYATAASNYGEGGFCVKEGVIRTHQLTEYVIDNYGVTGYVYLFGASMGGAVALELGAKYPDLYDGVFDLFGPKNVLTAQPIKMHLASLTNDADLIAALTGNGSAVPPFPFSLVPGGLSAQLAFYRAFCLESGIDMWLACGGNTPEEKPQAYERLSPIFSATDIAVPTITLHGTADGVVFYSSSVEFMNAVAAAGHSDLYRLYKVVGKGHGDISNAQILLRFGQLVDWVENGNPPSTGP